MKISFLNEIKRAFHSLKPFGALVFCLLIYWFSFSPDEWRSMLFFANGTVVDKHNIFLLEFNPYKSLLPLAATIPYCSSVAEDWEHRASYCIVPRLSFERYSLIKFGVSGFLGGAVLFVSLSVFLCILSINLPLYNANSYFEPFIEPILVYNSKLLYVAYWGSLQFFLGFLCAGIGCFVAALTTRRGVLNLFPMLLFAMLEVATGFTVIGLSGGQSSIIFNIKNQTPINIYLHILLILFFLIITIYFLFRYTLKRRLYEWQ